MTSTTITVGEHLYDATAKFTKVTEFGISLEDLAAGKTSMPPQGARIDVAFEGVANGPKLKGTVTGVDYIHIRADGRYQLHIHAELTTEDGAKIAAFAEGVSIPEKGTTVAQLRENATLTTSSQAYSWVNQLHVWIQGTVDMATQEINLKAYAA